MKKGETRLAQDRRTLTDTGDVEKENCERALTTAEPRLSLASSHELDEVPINLPSRMLFKKLLQENPDLEGLLERCEDIDQMYKGIRNIAVDHLEGRPAAEKLYRYEAAGREMLKQLSWQDHAAIRLLDYVDNAGREFQDPTLRGGRVITDPIRVLWLAWTRCQGGAQHYFFQDWIMLMRQFRGALEQDRPTYEKVEEWMERWPSGLEQRVVDIRERNKERILRVIVRKLSRGEILSTRFTFEPGSTDEQKLETARRWWNDHRFHLSFAVRDPETMNEFLGWSLHPATMDVLREAHNRGIPFFANPYYLSLINVNVPHFAIGADIAIRDYVFHSRQLVEEFGHIVAWEKEDQVRPGEPNAAGWLLPSHRNVHRRYPEVAILIPETMGRACGGLCSVCQRMYDFQRGHLNFNLDKLKPDETWRDRLRRYLDYFENDSQLRDILVTGGDALMSSEESLETVLDAVCEMARRKKEANLKRPNGKKYAEMVRVRLGTRLPAYLPMRITDGLAGILAGFKKRAESIGIKQFVIQTHFVSSMEITPLVAEAVAKLNRAGWVVTNQQVFTAAASRRGHTAKLRRVLGEVGILPYYTFSVKGHMENQHDFATNARAMQEQIEEKRFGIVPAEQGERIRHFPEQTEKIAKNLRDILSENNLPFLATDRNVLNLPGVGKSLTYRTIGITRYGRRILEFDHDKTRNHSPIIDKMGKVIVIESKAVTAYLEQLAAWGEEISEYDSVYGYSIGETEPRQPIYEYPGYDFEPTSKLTNLDV